MRRKKIDSIILSKIEKLARKEALACQSGIEPPWPECKFILHQPKRPRK